MKENFFQVFSLNSEFLNLSRIKYIYNVLSKSVKKIFSGFFTDGHFHICIMDE